MHRFAPAFVLAVACLSVAGPRVEGAQRTRPAARDVRHSITYEQSPESAAALKLFQEGTQLSEARQYDGAVDKFERALELVRADSDRVGEAVLLNSIGVARYRSGDAKAAAASYALALDAAHASKDRSSEATALYNLGLASYALDQQADAILDYYSRALTLYHELGDRTGEADTLYNMGVVYQWSGSQAEADQFFQRSKQTRGTP